MIEKKYSQYYQIIGNRELTNIIRDKIKDITEIQENAVLRERMIKKSIEEEFSNRIIIIDEIHSIKKQGKETDEKDLKIMDALEKILENSKNIKLILMSATPMFDSPSEIIDLINLLLINDNKPKIREQDVFYIDEHQQVILKKEGEQILKDNVKSYISFFRGDNPISFPSLLEPNDIKLKNLYKNNELYIPNPKKTFRLTDDNSINIRADKKIKYTKLVKCNMSDYHFKYYSTLIKDPEYLKKDVAEQQVQELSNFIYPIDKNFSGMSGRKGFNNAFSQVKDQFEYKYFNVGFLTENNLKKYSSKFSKILENIKKSPGISFIFLEHLNTGIDTMSMILEEAGYEPFYKKFILKNRVNKLKICSICNKYKTDIIHSSGKCKFVQAKYVSLTGQDTQNERQIVIDKLKEDENKYGELIKVIIGSNVLKEGADLSNIRQIHFGNAWHNMSKLIQITGRGRRLCSHRDLKENERDVTVFRYSVTYPEKILKNKKEEMSVVETVDELMWRRAENKDIQIKKIERILKINSVDCEINKNSNYFSPTKFKYGDKDYSRECDYMKCDFKCEQNSKGRIDKSTKEMRYIGDDNINVIKNFIKNQINLNLYISLDKLTKNILDYGYYENELIQSIDELLGNEKTLYPEIVYYNNIPGILLLRSDWLVFQPLNEYGKNFTPKTKEDLSKGNIENYKSNLISIKNEYKISKGKSSSNNKSSNLEFIIKELLNIREQEKFEYEIEHSYFNIRQKILENIYLNIIDENNIDNKYKKFYNYFKKYLIKKNIITEIEEDDEYYGYIKLSYNPRCYKYDKFIDCDFNETRRIEKYLRFEKPKDLREDNDIFSYVIVDRNNNLVFKIVDKSFQKIKVRIDNSIAKNTITTGKVCSTFDKQSLEKYARLLNIDIKKINRKNLCKELEMAFRTFENKKINNKKWFYNIEEWNEKNTKIL